MELLLLNKDSNINNRYSYHFDEKLHNVGTNHYMPSGNLLNNFSITNNKFEIPFMNPSQIQSNIKKKFEDFTSYFSRKKNIIKYSMSHWNKIRMGHSNFITQQSKNGSCVSSPIASYLIGGFVGSKSQMNNEKHNLSYDLGGVIFKILNDCNYRKLYKKTREEKKLEINKCVRKSKSFVKNSEESFEYCDLLMFGNAINEFQNSNTILKQNKSKKLVKENFNSCSLVSQIEEKKPENFSNNSLENLAFSRFRISIPEANETSENIANLNEKSVNSNETPIDHINMKISKIELLQEALLDYTIDNSNICKTTGTSCNSGDSITQNVTNEKSYISIKSTKSEQLNGEIEKNDLNLTISSCMISVNSLSGSRTRQCSECSLESTDSESFIVFDDRCCDSSFDELQSSLLQESENDESDLGIEEEEEEEEEEEVEELQQQKQEEEEEEIDNDSIENESDFCCIKDSDESDVMSEDKEVTEANTKWAMSYGNVTDDLGKTGRKVKFSEKVAIHRIIAWDYAYRAARIGPWEQMVRDRNRFRERIQRLGSTISPILLQSHREKIYLKFYV